MVRIGALEGGGTKMVMGVYSLEGEELIRETIPTEAPDITVPKINDFFKKNRIDALGIGSFGPVDLHRNSSTYGYITSTPKLAWQYYPLMKNVLLGMDVPCDIDLDVNAAVIAETELGAAKGCSSTVYVTVGTGIGAGIMIGGETVHGILHPEAGHILLRPHPDDPIPEGVCPFHKGCLEGLAAGPAIGARVGGDARLIPDDHPAFEIEAYYLAQMCTNLILTISPEKVILGGGVFQRKYLLPMVRKKTLEMLNGYLSSDLILNHIDEYIVLPELFPVSGLVGSYLIGKKAWLNAKQSTLF